jgi:hypothetical protein
MEEFAADLGDSVGTCRQSGGVFPKAALRLPGPKIAPEFLRVQMMTVLCRSARGNQPFCCQPLCQRLRCFFSVIRFYDRP